MTGFGDRRFDYVVVGGGAPGCVVASRPSERSGNRIQACLGGQLMDASGALRRWMIRNLIADGDNHINGIENFWNQAKRYLRKFNGVPKHHFHLFLKECEWRFNEGSPKQLLRQLKRWVKLANKR